jgi:hypothetical protein
MSALALTRNGAAGPLLTAYGFGVGMIAALVNHEKVRDGGKLVEVAKVRITNAGRDALAAEE